QSSGLSVIGYCAECFFYCLCSVLFPLLDQTNITAESGQNIMLPCGAPTNNKQILAVQWSRADLKQEYVLLYRDEVFVPDNQHPAFKNRVDLQDRQMKDGDVSLILKNVMINDTGTYECRVFTRGTKHRMSTFGLSVVPPRESVITEGHRRLQFSFQESCLFPKVDSVHLDVALCERNVSSFIQVTSSVSADCRFPQIL
uniref:Ig-like domain-containing protein n=1 Tax=Oreochromis aureus TaxID=47969 RepID=A0A668RYE5_OREAU